MPATTPAPRSSEAPLRPHPLCRRASRMPARIVTLCRHCAMVSGYHDTRSAQIERLGAYEGLGDEDWTAATRHDGGAVTFYRWLTSGGWDGYRIEPDPYA